MPTLDAFLTDVRACTRCAPHLPHGVRPVFQFHPRNNRGPAESRRIGLWIRVPTKTERGSSFTLDLVQRENGKIFGGVGLRINAR